MKYLKSLTIAKNKEVVGVNSFILLDSEVCLKNMKMNETLVTNFLEVIKTILEHIEKNWILKDGIKAELLKNMKNNKDIEEEIKIMICINFYVIYTLKLTAK